MHILFFMRSPSYPVPGGFIGSPVDYSGCKIKREVKIHVIAANEIRFSCLSGKRKHLDLLYLSKGKGISQLSY